VAVIVDLSKTFSGANHLKNFRGLIYIILHQCLKLCLQSTYFSLVVSFCHRFNPWLVLLFGKLWYPGCCGKSSLWVVMNEPLNTLLVVFGLMKDLIFKSYCLNTSYYESNRIWIKNISAERIYRHCSINYNKSVECTNVTLSHWQDRQWMQAKCLLYT
jgi:hypothetical protein